MSTQKFEYAVLIRETHIDSFGHVNNAQYLTLFEEARWEIISARGFGLKEIRERGLGPIVLEVNLRFAKEIRLRQKITILSEVNGGPQNSRQKTLKMIQTMLNENGDVCCLAEFTFGLFDLRARRLVPPTPEWLHAIGVGE